MARDVFTQKSVKTPSTRLKDAFGNILFGFIFLLGGMYLLFWNEGRSIKRIRVLEEGKATLIELSADQGVLQENNEKLVYISTVANSEKKLRDPLFQVDFQGIALERHVQMYQWTEIKETHTEEDSNGNEETTTTYSYKKEWTSTPQNSSHFTRPENHQNPSMPFKGEEYFSDQVFVGELKLSQSFVASIKNASIMSLQDFVVPEPYGSRSKIIGDEVYIGGNPLAPKVGDMKVWFATTAPCVVSVIAQQKNGQLETYYAEEGTLQILKTGAFTSDELFASEEKSNGLLTWGLRIAGWLLAWVGCAMIFEIFDILAIFIPLVGSIVRRGVGLLIFVMASILSLLTIASGWVFYRPVLGYSLIGAAAVLLVLPFLRKKKV